MVSMVTRFVGVGGRHPGCWMLAGAQSPGRPAGVDNGPPRPQRLFLSSPLLGVPPTPVPQSGRPAGWAL